MDFVLVFQLAVTEKVRVFVRAVLMFELQAGMTDTEFLLQPVLDRPLDLFDLIPAVGRQHDVAIQRRFVLLHLPQMGGSIMRIPPS